MSEINTNFESESELFYKLFGDTEIPSPIYKKIIKDGYTWGWCETCRTAYVECPKCGNNCCNAGTGYLLPDGSRPTNEDSKNRTDLIKCGCDEAYNHQHKIWKEKADPQFEEFEIEKIFNIETNKYEIK